MTETPGTLGQEDGDALEKSGTTETPDTEQSRDAESGDEGTDWKKLALSYKSKVERVNELEAKVKELEGGSEQPPVAESPDVQDKTNQIDKVEEQVEEFKRRGDPVAAFAMEERAARLRLERDIILQRQLDRIPEDEQDAVLKHFNKNRHRLGDIAVARSELREKRLERELAETKKRLELLDKPPDPEVMRAPPTHGREVGARETKKKLSEAQFDATAGSIRSSMGELAYMKYVRDNAGNVQ